MRSRRSGWTAALLAIAGLAGAAPSQSATLRFGEAVAAATRGTASVELASGKVKQSESQVGAARAALLPGLSGNAFMSNRTFNLKSFGVEFPTPPGSAGLADLQGPVDLVDARLKLTQTVFDPSSFLKLRAARQDLRGSRADRDAAAESAARGAALAYLRAARARALAEARAADARIARELLALAEVEQRAGTSPTLDATRARTEVAAAQGESLIAENQAGRARIDLARALGLPPGAPPVLGDTLSEALGESEIPTEPAAILPFALGRRPEVAAVAARSAKARSERAAISAERVPRLDASANWGVSGDNWTDAFPTREVGVALTLPLFDGLRRESRIAEQASKERDADIRRRDLADQVSAEVESALLDLASGREQLEVANQRLRLAEQELDQARDRFVSGVAGNIEIINAQASLVRARDAAIDARFAVATSRVALASAAGVAQTLH